MKASIVDLRYKTKEILKALDKNESVEELDKTWTHLDVARPNKTLKIFKK